MKLKAYTFVVFVLILSFVISLAVITNAVDTPAEINVTNVEKIKDRIFINGLRSNDSIQQIGSLSKAYDASKKKLIIKDNGIIKLDLQLESNYTEAVISKKDALIAWFRLYDFSGNNLVDNVRFYDANADYAEVYKNYSFKYKVKKNVSVCDFMGDNCVILDEDSWVSFNSLSDLPYKNIEIGLFTDIHEGDAIEWIIEKDGFGFFEWALVLGTNFGFVTTAPTSDPDGSTVVVTDDALATKDVSPAAAVKIVEIGWWSESPNGQNFEVGIYTDDGGNDPFNLIHVNRTLNLTSGNGWKTARVDWSISGSNTYWIAVAINGSSNANVEISGGPGRAVESNVQTLPGDANSWGFDTDGLYGIYAVWKPLDEIAPNVTINSPLNQTYNNISSLFNVTAVDETMGSCEYSLTGGLINYSMTNIGNEWNATNSTMSQGSHTANFYCNDVLNNLNNSEEVTFIINSTAEIHTITLEIVYPFNLLLTQNVSQNTFFNITVNVTCLGAECGLINVSLDPIGMDLPHYTLTDESQFIKEREKKGYSRYIVELEEAPLIKTKHKGSKALKEKSIKDQQKKFVSDLDLKINYNTKKVRELSYLTNAVIIEIKDEDIDKVKEIAEVKNVWKDEVAHISLQDSVGLINASNVWGYQNSSGSNITGEGIIVAIIDSGIYYNHTDFEVECTTDKFIAGECIKTIYGWDFVNDDPDPMDDNGHGTHVAGIIGANGNLKGVAPNVTFIVYKVCDYAGSCALSDILSAIENATLNGADIISMSLGGVGSIESAYSTPIKNAMDGGTVIIAAIGNGGPNYFTADIPGADPNAIGVGAISKTNVLADFSSRGFSLNVVDGLFQRFGIKPDVVAPGVNINSTASEIGINSDLSGYKVLNGTSMSTPMVSGVVALIKQAHPDWTAYEIKSAITNPAIDLGYNPIEQGSGRVDAFLSYNISSVVMPSNLFMGNLLNRSLTSWNSTKELNLTNLASGTLEYNLSIDFNEAGIIANLTEDNFTLGSGESVIFNLTLEIDTSAALTNTYFGNVIVNISDGQILKIPFGFYIETDVKGLIPDIYGAKPFYTNESNPRTINLSENESQIITFWVNPTGNVNTTYEFFVFANSSSAGVVSNVWNVTIGPPLPSYPSFFNYLDNNGSLTNSGIALLQITIDETNTSVGVDFNGANYTTYTSNNWLGFNQWDFVYVTVGAAFRFGENKAVSMWINSTGDSISNQSLSWEQVSFAIDLVSSDTVRCIQYNLTVNETYNYIPYAFTTTLGYELNDSTWHHLVCKFDQTNGNNFSLWIDGVVENSTIIEEIGPYPAAARTTWLIGGTAIGGRSGFVGVIDDVRNYFPKPFLCDPSPCSNTNQLSDAEIIEIYSSGRVRNNSLPGDDTLAMYYPFDEGEGDTTESFGNGYFDTYGGLLAGATWKKSGVYNINISINSSGVYPYYWWANGDNSGYNISDTFYYTVHTANYTVTITEAINYRDILGRLLSLGRSIIQSFNYNEISNRILAADRSITQSFNSNDLLTRLFSPSRNLIQSFNSNDISNRMLDAKKNIIQSFNYNDLLTRVFSQSRSITQSFNSNDLLTRLFNPSRIIIQSFNYNAIPVMPEEEAEEVTSMTIYLRILLGLISLSVMLLSLTGIVYLIRDFENQNGWEVAILLIITFASLIMSIAIITQVTRLVA